MYSTGIASKKLVFFSSTDFERRVLSFSNLKSSQFTLRISMTVSSKNYSYLSLIPCLMTYIVSQFILINSFFYHHTKKKQTYRTRHDVEWNETKSWIFTCMTRHAFLTSYVLWWVIKRLKFLNVDKQSLMTLCDIAKKLIIPKIHFDVIYSERYTCYNK